MAETARHGRGPVPYWPFMGLFVVVFLCWYAATHAVRPGAAQLIGMVVIGMVGTSVMDMVEWWNGDVMDDPWCCGQPMTVSEYDKDYDRYLYVCDVNPDHEWWVWK